MRLKTLTVDSVQHIRRYLRYTLKVPADFDPDFDPDGLADRMAVCDAFEETSSRCDDEEVLDIKEV